MAKQTVTQIGLRVPEDIRRRIEREAERGGRSSTQEIVRRLVASFETDSTVADLKARIAALESRVDEDAKTIRQLSGALASIRPDEIAAALQKAMAKSFMEAMKSMPRFDLYPPKKDDDE